MQFNEKLQELRKQKGVTQEELAKAIYVSRTAISKWESNRGYPNIESLRALSSYFSVTIDELLSENELLTLAQEDTQKTKKHLMDLMFGLLDIGTFIFLFLPLFGEKYINTIHTVSLIRLNTISQYVLLAYYIIIIIHLLFGILLLALQNVTLSFWCKNKHKISLLINGTMVLIFIITTQPYATLFSLLFLAIKIVLITKKRQ